MPGRTTGSRSRPPRTPSWSERQLKSIGALGSKDAIDDILITLTTQYDIVRPLGSNPAIFLYLAMDKNKSNLAMARYKVAECEKQLELQLGAFAHKWGFLPRRSPETIESSTPIDEEAAP